MDGRGWAFDLKLEEQTIGTEDPAKVSAVLGDVVSGYIARYFNYQEIGLTETEWANMHRAVYRPRAGKVFTVSIREAFKSYILGCLPPYIFVMDADKKESKFKLSWLEGRVKHCTIRPLLVQHPLVPHVRPDHVSGVLIYEVFHSD